MVLSFVKAFDDFAEITANPPANRPVSNAVGQFGRKVCDAISARPDLYAPTILQSPFKIACQPYWDGAGYSAPIEEVPFQGGQCPVAYGVRYQSRRFEDGQWRWSGTTTIGAIGPISIRKSVDRPPFDCEFLNQVDSNAGIFNGAGVQVQQLTNACVDIAPGYRIIEIFREDQQPDSCGDPPPDFKPGPTPAPDPGPFPPGTGPGVNVRGVPIVILPPTVTIAPGVEVNIPNGEVNIGTGGGATPTPGAPLPTADPIPGAGGDDGSGGPGAGGGGDNLFGEPPLGERWVGCCVHIVARPVGHGSIPQSEPQTIFPDTIGNARLIFGSQSKPLEYDTPLINKQKTTCLWEPVRGFNPKGVRVNLRPGFDYSYTPYSVPDTN